MKTKIETSNKWRNTIRIKHLFEDETTPELIVKLTDSLILQLKKLQEKEAKSNLTDDEKWRIDGKIEDLIGNFEFLKELADGTIPESEWDNYSFDGEFQAMFNGYFSELYDLGDEKVLTTDNILEKFIWIK